MNAKEILLMKMTEPVFVENRPFSFKYFLSFEYDVKEYNFEHSTIRIIFLRLKKEKEIELDYISGVAFYTLKGA